MYSLSTSQTLIDIKTKYNEKKQLHFIKLALITSLDTSGWCRTTEIGEQFSLWLKNFKRTPIKDSLLSEFDLEFHTPAMISEGNIISSNHISILFDTTGLFTDTIPTDTLLNNLIVQYLSKTNLLNKFLKLLGIPFHLVSANPIISYFAQNIVMKHIKEFTKQPSPLEIVEASLLSTKALSDIHEFIKQRYPHTLKQ